MKCEAEQVVLKGRPVTLLIRYLPPKEEDADSMKKPKKKAKPKKKPVRKPASAKKSSISRYY